MYHSPTLRELTFPSQDSQFESSFPFQPTEAHARSFNDLVRPHLDAMTSMAARVVGCRHLAQDVVQEVLSVVWSRGWLPAQPCAALCHLARLRALQQLRSDRRRCNHERCTDALPKGYEPDPSSVLDRAERIGLVRSAIDALDTLQRQAIELHVFDGLPYSEVAKVCGVAVGTVRSRLHRARRELTRLLGTTFVEELAA
ncbi:MAG: RNA polymerase sigma-70 factor (ECF subfamily) [Kiritimatiellia bacterium]|jgi:RNA polymerase sigma-70 factor (ECF subfamily)